MELTMENNMKDYRMKKIHNIAVSLSVLNEMQMYHRLNESDKRHYVNVSSDLICELLEIISELRSGMNATESEIPEDDLAEIPY